MFCYVIWSRAANIWADQPLCCANGCKFQTTTDAVRPFLDLSYMLSICKLPTIKCHGAAESYIGNNGIRNAMTRTQSSTILQNLHFANNHRPDKSDKAYKLRPVMDNLNTAYQAVMSNTDKQANTWQSSKDAILASST